MKNTVVITLDSEKFSALKVYLGQKNTSLDDEVSKYCEQLYAKVVPQTVRDFIDMTSTQQTSSKRKKTAAKQTDTPTPPC